MADSRRADEPALIMKRKRFSKKKQIQFLAAVIITVILYFLQYFSEGKLPQAEEYSAPIETETLQSPRLLSVYDGDTFKIDLNCQEEVLCKNISVRVRGIDCPEIKGKTKKEKNLAQKAKSFTENFLQGKTIVLENCERDKYFRLLCDVKAADQDLAENLLKAGLAYPYDGGSKKDIFQ